MCKYKVIDLFAGCGGFSDGFKKQGFSIEKAVEIDKNIAQIYKINHPNTEVIVEDIKNIDNSNIFSENMADVIIGGPPCQGFSMAGSRNRKDFIDDPRNYLFKHYFNIVRTIKPKIFIIENVKGLISMNNGEIFREIINIFQDKELLENPYNIFHTVIDSSYFGVPQKRERLIIIGTTIKNIDFHKLWNNSILEIKSIYPTFFNVTTVADAINNLSSTTITGEIINPNPISDYQKYLSTNENLIFNHTKTNHSQIAIDRIKQISAGENYSVLNEQINSIHSGSYGRLDWNSFAPTITTRFDTPTGGRFIHPIENRTISPREAARLQSFSDNFKFHGTKSTICKAIGNAVPPKVSYFLATLSKNILNNKE